MKDTKHSEEWEAKRRHILDVAAGLFAEKGFSGGTTRELASLVGLTQPALYYYVGSKDDLLSEVTMAVDSSFYDRLAAAIDGTDNARDRMRAVIRGFVEMMGDHHRVIGLRFTESRSLPEALSDLLAEDERRFVRLFETAVRDAMEAGYLPSDRNPRLVTLGILGMLSWMFRWYSTDSYDADEVVETFCELVGVGAKARRRPKR